MTVLYTTHLMEEAQELSDRVAIMDHGEIIAMGTQDELTQQVGEEDRLEFTIGAEEIDEALFEHIQLETQALPVFSSTRRSSSAMTAVRPCPPF